MYSTVPFLTHLHGDASARCLRLRAILTPNASLINKDRAALKAGVRRDGCGAILSLSRCKCWMHFPADQFSAPDGMDHSADRLATVQSPSAGHATLLHGLERKVRTGNGGSP